MKSHRHHHGGSRRGPASDELPSPPFVAAAAAVASTPAGPIRRSSIPAREQAAEVTREVGVGLPAEVYLIGCSGATGPGQPSPNSMGAKAWNLLRMQEMALPVPPAFVLGTHYCIDPAARQQAATPALWQGALVALERATGLSLGDARRPLLLSVRSGAPVSMPGMMETILNIGLCDTTVGGLLRQTGNPRLVWDAYRRLVATYGEVVAGLPGSLFTAANAALFGARDERDLDFAEMRLLARRLLEVYAAAAGRPFPQTPKEQLSGAIEAVFASWSSAKAREYRRLNCRARRQSSRSACWPLPCRRARVVRWLCRCCGASLAPRPHSSLACNQIWDLLQRR